MSIKITKLYETLRLQPLLDVVIDFISFNSTYCCVYFKKPQI